MKNERAVLTNDAVISRGILYCGAGTLYNTNQTTQVLFDSAVHVEGGRLYGIKNTPPTEAGTEDFVIQNDLTYNTGYDVAFGNSYPAQGVFSNTATDRILANVAVYLFNPGTLETVFLAFHRDLASGTGSVGHVWPADLLVPDTGANKLEQLVDKNGNKYWNIPAGWNLQITMRQIQSGGVHGSVLMGCTSYCEKY